MTNSSRLSALCDGIIEAGWLAAVILVPLFFNVHSSRVFEPDKLTLLRSIALVMIAAWIVRTIEERSARGRTDTSATSSVSLRTPLVLATTALVAVYLITTALSITPRVSFFGSYQRLQGTYTTFSYIVIFFMIVQIMRERQQLDRLITAIVMTSMPIAFYGLLQRGDGITTLDPLPWGGDVTSRVAANMGNAIFIAAYLIMAFFLTLGRVIEAFRVILTEEESRWSDILRASAYIFVASVQLISFAFANSRGPLLGWLPGMFILGLVGLIMLRISLQSVQTPSEHTDDPFDVDVAPMQFRAFDVIKALLLAVISIGVAGVAALLAYNAFPTSAEPNVALAAVAALIGGLVPLLIAAGIRRTAARWLWTSWIFFSIIGAIGLFWINFSDHPRIVELRESGTFGSLGTLFESEGGTGRVRTLIWEGAVNLISPHDPLAFPDGSFDALNPVRPLIGYGPESMYVAYNRFYPPELAQLEQRNASPDRSHNETLDSFVITGGIGFIAEQFVFLSVFFYALKFIGWIPNRKAAIMIFSLMISAGILFTVVVTIVFNINFIGVGWPAGVTAGLVLYVISFALFHFQISPRVYAFASAALIAIVNLAIFGATFTSDSRLQVMLIATVGSILGFGVLYQIGNWAFGETAGEPIPVSGHIFLIMALFGGILAHYLEISLAGIAIAATRTYFWTFAGVLVVTGLNWVKPDVADKQPEPVTQPEPVPAPTPRHKKKKKKRRTSAKPYTPRLSIRNPATSWVSATIALALIGTIILGALGYEFIIGPPPQIESAQSAVEVISRALTRLPYQDNRVSPGIILMFLVTWLFGAVVSLTELRRRGVLKPGNQFQATLTYIGVSITVAFIYWLVHASQILNAIDLSNPSAGAATIEQSIEQFLAPAEVFAGLLGWFYVFVFGVIFLMGWVLVDRSQVKAYVSPVAALASGPLFLLALLLLISTNFNLIRADTVYKQSQAFIGGNVCDAPAGHCDIAISQLKQALKYAPEEDFYMLTLGAGYLNKSSAPFDPESADLLLDNSSFDSIINLNAETTLTLSRNDSLIAARATLKRAQEVNPLNTDHAANLARMHRSWSDLASSEAEREQLLNTSSDFYMQATTLSPNNAQLWNEWAVVYFTLYDAAQRNGDTEAADLALDEVQNRLERSLQIDDNFTDTYRWLGSLYNARGDAPQAEEAWLTGLQISPTHFETWALLTEHYIATNKLEEAEQLAIDFLELNPTNLPALRTLSRNIYFPQGRIVEAINIARGLIEISGGDPEHWQDQMSLAEMLRVSGNFVEALPFAQAALQLAPEHRKGDAQSVLDLVQAGLQPPSSP